MKNTKKKGFTLVELLVVIAIIAILAGASIVGYLGFTAKAKQSNAVNELTQYKTTAIANLAEGSSRIVLTENGAGEADDVAVLFEYNFNNDAAELKFTKINAGDLTAAMAKLMDVDAAKIAVADDGTKVTTVTYTYEEGVTAVWTIANNEVK